MRLIYRDYHPGNTLWSRGRISGVVDWTQASSGPTGLDVGHMRWNLILDHGQEIADRFLACHRSVTGTAGEHQPYWDLVSLLELLLEVNGEGPGDLTPADVQRLEDYARTVLTRTT